jgi:BASS family bile acid:Na+ symporter
MTAITSSAAVVMTPFNLAFWASLDPDTRALLSAIAIDPWQMFTAIFLILALPLAVGMWVRSHFETFSARIQRPIRVAGGSVFLGFILLAFYQARAFLTVDILPVLGIVIVHNALALGLGYTVARLLRLPCRDRRAVTIEVGVQNSGLGLALVFNFFAGLGGVAIVAAWWGTWHLVGGFVAALVWSRVPVGLDPGQCQSEPRQIRR